MLETVGVLGPKGTNSERAAREWLRNSKIKYYSTIADVLTGASMRRVDYGAVPVEDSATGPVRTSAVELARLSRKNGIRIVGEHILSITHHLVGLGPLRRVKTVASHPQALDVCQNAIHKRLPRVKALRPVSSTAEAARMAAKDSTLAAVAASHAAKEYGLKILEPQIGHSDTRFVFVSKKAKPHATGFDKTSVAVYLREDKPGALYELLGEFASRSINLTRIESVPVQNKIGEYFFYIDMEGHEEDRRVAEALRGIERKAEVIRLGSYPRARPIIPPSSSLFDPPIAARPLTEASDEEILYGAA